MKNALWGRIVTSLLSGGRDKAISLWKETARGLENWVFNGDQFWLTHDFP